MKGQARYELRPSGETIDRTTGARVVLKELTLGRMSDWKELELFEREVAVLRQLRHPSIPAFVDEFRSEEGAAPRYFLVHADPGGSSLRTAPPRDEPALVAVARGALEVLAYLQSFTPPVLHRNITPDALLVRGAAPVALVDFGAVQVELRGTTGGSTMVGTSGYMAPEQLLGRAGPASDVYALGASLVFVLTGCEPADLPLDRMRLQWRSRAHFGSPRLLDWVERAVAPDPRDRFADAADALRALGDDGPLGAAILASRPAGSNVELERTSLRLELNIPAPRSILRFGGLGAGLGHLVLDVDRGYRVLSPDHFRHAGPFADVVGTQTGFRGIRGSLWLTTRTAMHEIGRGLTEPEQAWLRDEIAAFLREAGMRRQSSSSS